jgi:hypothetical protein
VRLGTQIGLGLLLAGIGIAVLQWYVAVAADEAPGAPAPVRQTLDRAPPPDLAAGGRDVLQDFEAVAGSFHLAPSRDALPPGCAPVLRVLAGGSIVVPVAPPLAMRPGSMRFERVGILLPQARISDLSAAERSSLLAIWSRLRGDAPLTASRIQVHGCRFEAGELSVLLRWLR